MTTLTALSFTLLGLILGYIGCAARKHRDLAKLRRIALVSAGKLEALESENWRLHQFIKPFDHDGDGKPGGTSPRDLDAWIEGQGYTPPGGSR